MVVERHRICLATLGAVVALGSLRGRTEVRRLVGAFAGEGKRIRRIRGGDAVSDAEAVSLLRELQAAVLARVTSRLRRAQAERATDKYRHRSYCRSSAGRSLRQRAVLDASISMC